MSYLFVQQCYFRPRCKACKGLLRPHVVWFGEGLEEEILGKKAVFHHHHYHQYFESATDPDPDPVIYLSEAPDPGSQTNPNLDSDLALLSHEAFNYNFA